MKDMDRTTGEYLKLNNSHVASATDKYTVGIDLSNACRRFYQSRMITAESVKEKLRYSGRPRTSKKTTSIDVAMETLRTEMCSLVDQDLSLMKQLLTLNEAIEDLKWQKNYYRSQSSMPASSCSLGESDWSVSETDMYESDTDDLRKFPTTESTSDSRLTRQDKSRDCVDISVSSTNGSNIFTSIQMQTEPCVPTHVDLLLDESTDFCDEEQTSFDSGIHDDHVIHTEMTT